MKESDKKKQKLTLSVDPDVIKKARGLGINISEITEGILRGFSFTPSGIETDALYEKYEQLFETMMPLLKKYGASVEIGAYQIMDGGELVGLETIDLLAEGELWCPGLQLEFKNIKEIKIYFLHKPKDILTKFIETLSQSAENNKQQLTELEMARRIIEAISGTPPKKVSLKSKTRKSDKNRQGKK